MTVFLPLAVCTAGRTDGGSGSGDREDRVGNEATVPLGAAGPGGAGRVRRLRWRVPSAERAACGAEAVGTGSAIANAVDVA